MCFTAKCLRCPFRSRARNNTDAKSGTYIIIPEIMAVCQGIFTKKIKLGAFYPYGNAVGLVGLPRFWG